MTKNFSGIWVPLVLYDVPYRTGVGIALDTLLALAAHPNIRAIRDCAGSLETTLALIRDGRLQVLAGWPRRVPRGTASYR